MKWEIWEQQNDKYFLVKQEQFEEEWRKGEELVTSPFLYAVRSMAQFFKGVISSFGHNLRLNESPVIFSHGIMYFSCLEFSTYLLLGYRSSDQVETLSILLITYIIPIIWYLSAAQ